MRRYWAYLLYVLRHKWFVFRACCKARMVWRGLIHDLSKFHPCEFIAYAHHFYYADGGKRSLRDSTGAYNPCRIGGTFDQAWLHHQRNKHHWQAWCIVGDNGSLKPLPIPESHCVEMICDWIGAGMAQSGKATPYTWWEANRSKMVLEEETARTIDRLLRSGIGM